jgi:hypothetical protein
MQVKEIMEDQKHIDEVREKNFPHPLENHPEVPLD